ncbi:hypothetical protein CUMW_272450 [Citrus unshiu]|uniref:ABC transporter domain-containing protein n=1 Tax=Citrus unshiu TaxID=55188 RepID=A0A2H5MUY1_CITUN|nr:hypothetical protein CUMW_272450 [Citrus unshiu]
MVSDASKKKALQKKAAAAAKRGGKAAAAAASSKAAALQNGSAADKAASEMAAMQISDRTCTGVLCSHPLSRDIRIESLSVTFHGHDLIVDSELELNYGRRYGLLGLNGCGKSTLLTAIGCRELPIPDHMDIHHLTREIEASDMSSLEAVISCDEERLKLEKEAEFLGAQDKMSRAIGQTRKFTPVAFEAPPWTSCNALADLHITPMAKFHLSPLLPRQREREASQDKLFTFPFPSMRARCLQKFQSFTWRFRKCQQNFCKLGLRTLISPYNTAFTKVPLWNTKVSADAKGCKSSYTGNFDQYVQDSLNWKRNQMKTVQWEQEQMASMKELYSPIGHGRTLSRQDRVKRKHWLRWRSAYRKVVKDKEDGGGEQLERVYERLEALDASTAEKRAAEILYGLVLTRLCKLRKRVIFSGGLENDESSFGWTQRIAQFHQHLAEKLDMDMPALQYMIKEYPGNEEEKMRAAIGRFGLTGKAQVMPMKNLSDGQRSRVVFAWLAYRQPHMLLLDEPTNHLDIETIDSLAEALNEWDGGLVLVSHDFRLINQVAHEIWVCENQAVTRWEGDIMDFKQHLKAKAGLSD